MRLLGGLFRDQAILTLEPETDLERVLSELPASVQRLRLRVNGQEVLLQRVHGKWRLSAESWQQLRASGSSRWLLGRLPVAVDLPSPETPSSAADWFPLLLLAEEGAPAVVFWGEDAEIPYIRQFARILASLFPDWSPARRAQCVLISREGTREPAVVRAAARTILGAEPALGDESPLWFAGHVPRRSTLFRLLYRLPRHARLWAGVPLSVLVPREVQQVILQDCTLLAVLPAGQEKVYLWLRKARLPASWHRKPLPILRVEGALSLEQSWETLRPLLARLRETATALLSAQEPRHYRETVQLNVYPIAYGFWRRLARERGFLPSLWTLPGAFLQALRHQGASPVGFLPAGSSALFLSLSAREEEPAALRLSTTPSVLSIPVAH